MKHELLLYALPTCPYCKRVVHFMEEKGIQIPVKDMSNSEVREELRELTGRTQVPCLFIDGSPLFESSDIVNWMEEHLV